MLRTFIKLINTPFKMCFESKRILIILVYLVVLFFALINYTKLSTGNINNNISNNNKSRNSCGNKNNIINHKKE
jgi:ABC-type spermidine/putrescine transport system permease subunit I